MFFRYSRQSLLPEEGEKGYKSLRDYSNNELINLLNENEKEELIKMAGVVSEILRRMNEVRPLLQKDEE